jgi:hypothetical protein
MRWILFTFTFPGAVLSYVAGILSMVFWLARKPRIEQTGILSLELREWFASGTDGKGPWDYSTTFVRTVWWQPGLRDETEELDERIEKHETVHLRQWEDYMMLSYFVGLFSAIPMWVSVGTFDGFAMWFWIWCSGVLWHLPNFVTAMLRFGARHGYRDSEHERSAYAQTDVFHRGESWWDLRDRIRGNEETIPVLPTADP